MQLNPDDIRTLVETVWEATLGMPLMADSQGAAGGQSRSTAATIQITGAWNGAVLLDCPGEVARKAAASMFAVTPERVQVSEMQDAVAELVNMIGGNLKSLLPEPCYLSLPSAIEGGDYSARMPGSCVLHRLAMLCDGRPVTITILQRTEEARKNAA